MNRHNCIAYSLLILCFSIPFPVLAQWQIVGDSIVSQGNIVYSLKIAPDHSIWALSSLDLYLQTQIPQIHQIHRSSDEGQHWITSKAPVENPTYGWDISPIDSMTAFITLDSAGLYKTSNGGQDWIKVETYPYSCLAVHFFNKNEGWVFSGRNSKSIGLHWMVHSLTKDGGKSWIHIGGENWNQPQGTSLPDQDSNELPGYKWTMNSSYDYTDNSIIIGMASGIYWMSKDKGYNWTKHETPLKKLGVFTANVAMKDTETFMVAGNYNPREGMNTLSFTTLDGGKTWLEGKPGVTAAATHYIPESDSIFIMIGHYDFNWGGSKGTAITYDYGANWKLIDHTRLISLDFVDKNFGFAIYGNIPKWPTATGQIYKWDFELPTSPQKTINWLLWILPLTILAIGFFLHRYRIQQVRKETQTTLQLSALERSALQAQMNPHFIFNALNSLQSFINNNERENSNIFLSHFSRLIRGTLQASMKEKTSLESEIELLESYLELEKMRFDNRFDYRISIGEDIDIEKLEVPSMITQPFVENAIIHGLSKKSSNGMVKLDYRLREKYLMITIQDNGRGIYHTQKNKNSLHKSVGMSNTLKRLKLINPGNEMHVKELKEEDGKITGTKISLSIHV